MANWSAWSRRRCWKSRSESSKKTPPTAIWLRSLRSSALSEFLAIDVFKISAETCATFLDPLIDSWDIDLKTFGVEIVLNNRLAPGVVKRFEFVDREPEPFHAVEPGLEEFLKDASFSGDANEEEIEFLKRLKFREKRPTPIYYYRELQNLRDPLHFRA